MDVAPRFDPSPVTTEPLIITCAITGDQNKANNPNLPITLEEQVGAAIGAVAAGASIIHIHGRDPFDPNRPSFDSAQYRRINNAIRAATGALLDNTQMTSPPAAYGDLVGEVAAYTAENLTAGPEIMSLNPGPMTVRGGASAPSRALVTTFDDTFRTAERMRELGIKPQVFIYHPGHLDILHELIERDLLAPPPFVQLVFGQQGGISATIDSFTYMVRNLPPGIRYQTCALGLAAVEVNSLSIIAGGHVRTGMEDTLLIRPGELAVSNAQLVERIVRFARDLGREIATPAQTRALLGLPAAA